MGKRDQGGNPVEDFPADKARGAVAACGPVDWYGIDPAEAKSIRINTFAADGLVGKKRGRAVVAVYPGIELPHPSLRRQVILKRTLSSAHRTRASVERPLACSAAISVASFSGGRVSMTVIICSPTLSLKVA